MAEVQALKAQNMLYHEEEIYSRPKKTWFQTEKEKKELKGIYHSFILPLKKSISHLSHLSNYFSNMDREIQTRDNRR